MLGKRRSPYDFLFEITQACQEPIGKTDLYHIIRTTHGDFERWLNVAIRLKLIEVVDNNKYQITQKGRDFLTRWQELQIFLKEE